VPYKALHVANTLVDIATQNGGHQVTPLQLMKLVYFAHGWHLALGSEPLIQETIEAWKFGPVVRSLYHNFKEFGAGPIPAPLGEVDMDTWDYTVPILQDNESLKVRTFLKKIWDVYGKFNGAQLSALTHEINSPWYVVWNNQGGKDRKFAQIPDNLIKEYFCKKITPTPPATQVA
jgi:uncharacterized phage-associated protein